MRIVSLFLLFTLICIKSQSQNLIGFNKKEILGYMKKNRSEMNYNNVVNTKYSYLKYSDNLENQTALFFLNADSICKNVRIICDSNMRAQKIKEMNALYIKWGENKWLDKRNGSEFLIELKDDKWSTVISIDEKK